MVVYEEDPGARGSRSTRGPALPGQAELDFGPSPGTETDDRGPPLRCILARIDSVMPLRSSATASVSKPAPADLARTWKRVSLDLDVDGHRARA